MRQSIKFLIIILISGLIACVVADWFLQKGFEKSNDDVIGKLNELVNDSTYYEIVCFGSSRALAHLNPAIIEKETGKSVYNAGLNGGCVIDFNALFKVYLSKHRAPEMLVIHVDEFTLETQTISELPRYFPFIDNDILYENLKEYNVNFKVVKYIRFLRIMYYYDLLKWISLKSWLKLEARDEYRLVKGYRVNDTRWTSYFDERLPDRMKSIREMESLVEEEKKGEPLFREILELCKQHKIKLVFTSSPIIGGDNFPKYEHTITKFEKMAEGYDASFLWLHREQWNAQEHYYDFTHMNNIGADKYSQRLSVFINEHK